MPRYDAVDPDVPERPERPDRPSDPHDPQPRGPINRSELPERVGITVYSPELVETGILDANGRRLLKAPEPMGFLRRRVKG
jgi:hypothetical protein